MSNSFLRFAALFTFSLAPALLAALPAPATSAEAAKPLAIGTSAPGGALIDSEGKAVELAAAMAGKPTILVFYRGSWCPFCNRQLAALGEQEPQLLALGYQILAVSPDRAEGLKAMAGKNHLTYRLLSDRGMTASSAYGVAFRLSAELEKAYRGYGVELTPMPGGDGFWLPVPAVFIVDRRGVIQFVFSNPDYQVRLASDALLAAARAAAK